MECSGLYGAYLDRKNRGESLKWDDIGYEELYQLWGIEGIPDSMIATLFNIDQREVTKKRHNYNIKQANVATRQIWKKVISKMNEVPEYLERFKPAEETFRVQMVLNVIKQFSLEEKNALIILLADVPIFEDVYNDADRWYSLYNAVKR